MEHIGGLDRAAPWALQQLPYERLFPQRRWLEKEDPHQSGGGGKGRSYQRNTALPFTWTAWASWNTGLATKPSMTHKHRCNISTLNIYSARGERVQRSVAATVCIKLTKWPHSTCLWEINVSFEKRRGIWYKRGMSLRSSEEEEGGKRETCFYENSGASYWHIGINQGWQQDTCIESEVVEAW